MKLKALLLGALLLCATLLGGVAAAFDLSASPEIAVVALFTADEPVAADAAVVVADRCAPEPERNCQPSAVTYSNDSSAAIVYRHSPPGGAGIPIAANTGPGEDDDEEDAGGDIRSLLAG